MSSEETLMQVRRDKHQELNSGMYPLATTEIVWSVSEFLSMIDFMIYEGEIKTSIILSEVKGSGTRTLHGRLIAIRKSGAISFLKLADLTGNVQLVATRDNLFDYASLRLLDLGDIVEVIGEPVLTKTGERSLLLSSWKVLTKSHRSPPEKFAGISDQELKYRKRYLDLMSSEDTRSRFIVRTYTLRAIRSYMDSQSFLEVETPTLNTIASGANAKPFTTHHNALDVELRLRIAPELYLKRLLVGGFEKVYEIGRNYRNEGIDTRHNPEFTMMESYQAYGNFPNLISYTKNLLAHIEQYLLTWLPPLVKKYYLSSRNDAHYSLSNFIEIPMWDAVIHAASKAEILFDARIHPLIHNIDSEMTALEVTNTSNERLSKIDMKGLFLELNNCASNGERIYTLFEYLVEPFLTEDYRTEDSKKSLSVFITQYPSAVSPLARAMDKAPSLCDRFELFVNGRELANAFQELNNPDEQSQRFINQLESNQKDPMDFDSDYIEALEYGMPPAIGFGMGIDRLIMLLTNSDSIKDVILFPTLRPEK